MERYTGLLETSLFHLFALSFSHRSLYLLEFNNGSSGSWKDPGCLEPAVGVKTILAPMLRISVRWKSKTKIVVGVNVLAFPLLKGIDVIWLGSEKKENAS